MKYTLVSMGVALAPIVQGLNHQHGGIHARDHAKRAIVTTDVIETVTVYVTALPNVEPTVPAVAASSAQQIAGEKLVNNQYQQSSSSSSISAVLSSSTSSTSIQVAPVYVESSTPSSLSSASSTIATSTSVQISAPSSPAASSSTASASTASGTGISKANLTPNGKKAGLSGYVGIQTNAKAAFGDLAPYIGWYSDYTATTETTAEFPEVMGIPMLWGADGSACAGTELTSRLTGFKSNVASKAPEIMFGFYEPDCPCTMSSEMTDVSNAAAQWNALIAPLAAQGTILGSPSMCKQKDEDYLTPFNSSITTTWDVTSIHVNKNNIAGVQEDVEYYVAKYGKPIFVSEFACVDDSNYKFIPCTDQTEINTFIQQAVKYFEGNENVIAYGASNGEGLLNVWPLTTSAGELSATGQAYLSALKSL